MSLDPAEADPAAFAAFRQHVFGDPALQRLLRPIMDREVFFERVVALGAEAGYRFALADVAAAMREGQLVWLTHWVPVA